MQIAEMPAATNRLAMHLDRTKTRSGTGELQRIDSIPRARSRLNASIVKNSATALSKSTNVSPVREAYSAAYETDGAPRKNVRLSALTSATIGTITSELRSAASSRS